MGSEVRVRHYNREWDEALKKINMWYLSCHYPHLRLREVIVKKNYRSECVYIATQIS